MSTDHPDPLRQSARLAVLFLASIDPGGVLPLAVRQFEAVVGRRATEEERRALVAAVREEMGVPLPDVPELEEDVPFGRMIRCVAPAGGKR